MKRWAEKWGGKTRRMRHEANKQLSTLTLRDTQQREGKWKKEMKRLHPFACECVEIEFDDENNKQK